MQKQNKRGKLKNLLETILIFFAIIAVAIGFFFYSSIAHKPVIFSYSPKQDTHDTTGSFGTDFSRIDSQITLAIPQGKAQEVYDYLQKTYLNGELLKKTFPGLDLNAEQREDISQFTDVYYDTAYLDLYQSRNTIRFRQRTNTIDATDPKSGRMLVQVKITPPSRFDLRNELKFEVKQSVTDRAEDSKNTKLIDLVKSSLAEDFKAAIAPINPDNLRPAIILNQTRSRVYLDWDRENFLSFSVDEGEASVLGAKGKFFSVDIGLVETAYTEANEAKRAKMRQVNDFIISDLQKKFPELIKNSEDKYEIVLAQLIEKIPFFNILRLIGIV